MCPSPRDRLASLALAATIALPAATAAESDAAALGRLTYVEKQVETSSGSWEEAIQGSGFDIGERLRTGPEGLVRLDLPWMSLSLGSDAELRFPDQYLLSVVLEKGRCVLEARTREALKLVTPEAAIRGQGRAIVRREGSRTLVTCVDGRFEVEARGQGVSLSAGRGTVVEKDRAPSAAEDTPRPPLGESLAPGRDPVYGERDEPMELSWQENASSYQVELLPVGSDVILLQRDVGSPPATLAIPWGGAFRWRVSSRDGRGLEGVPSLDGLICIDLVK